MNSMKFYFVCMGAISSIISSSFAVERLVPTQYATIQAAIDDCNNGDVVIINPNTYTGPGNRDIDFNNLAITVRSIDPNDPSIVSATVIDCNGTEGNPHQGFYFHNNEGPNSVVDGLTITNGYGRLIPGEGPSWEGGGIYCSSSSPTIRKCTIVANSAEKGGGICCKGSNPTISECKITGNPAEWGGGIYSVSSSPIITKCIINNHSSSRDGSGIYCYSGNPTISYCIIVGNSAGGSGGGIFTYANDPMVTHCLISNNSAGGGGGGIYSTGTTYGAANTPTISHCTFTGNSADDGGGILAYHSNPNVNNCILWGDTAVNNGPEIALKSSRSPSHLTISYTDIQGGQAAVYKQSDCTLTWGAGNLSVDPNFVDPKGSDGIIGTPDDNLRLLNTSYCIDTGDNGAIPGGITTDLDGRTRIIDGDCNDSEVVDMGAYEFSYAYIGDFTSDCNVDYVDFSILALTWLKEEGQAGYDPNCDISISNDNCIDWLDLTKLMDNWLAGIE